MHVSKIVRQELHARFRRADAVVAEEWLESTPLPGLDDPGFERTRDRVHLGVLKRSGGELGLFLESLALAAEDWRDLLAAAGLENDDWPEVLRAAGYAVP